MKHYYIDYENVMSNGLTGIEQLTENDALYLFYSVNANTMTMDKIQSLLQCPADMHFIQIHLTGPNAMDFHLIAKLFHDIKDTDTYVIVSKDKGYEASIAMGRQMGFQNITRQDAISPKITETRQEPKITSIQNTLTTQSLLEHCKKKRIQISAHECETVLYAALQTDNKQAFYNYFVKIKGSSKGRDLYARIKSEYQWITGHKNIKV